MTAEVVILNRMAVALAADSAASLGEDAEKVYYTNKLFGLSKSSFCPVGIMIYESPDHLMTPLDTIIKLFREHTNGRPEATVRRYAEKFIAFCRNKRFLNKSAETAFVRNVSVILLERLRKQVEDVMVEEIERTGALPTRSKETILLDVIVDRLSKYRGAKPVKSLTGISVGKVARAYRAETDKAIQQEFPDFKLSKNLRNQAQKLAASFLLYDESDINTGVVIAGFGEREIFPHLINLKIDGAVCGKLKYWVVQEAKIDAVRNTSAIYPFAQHEMVERFVEGVDSDYLSWIDSTARKVFFGFAEELAKIAIRNARAQKAFLKQLPKIVETTISELSKSSAKFRWQEFIRPVLDAVDVLPKEELANMAEALVSLTSTKRRVSREKETVGGPVDVAVISKGDGFVWIKRKQYFKADLNPQFAARFGVQKEVR